MTEDLNSLANGLSLDCDLCIVGSGAAGLALANEFRGTSHRVIVLEGGGRSEETETTDLYRTGVSGHSFQGSTEGRKRIHGGTTTAWGGQSLPLTSFDFEKREWVRDSGWPICRSDLESFYSRAAAFLLTDPLNFDSDLYTKFGFAPPEFDPNRVSYHFSKWSRRPNLRETYGPLLEKAANVTLVLHANLTQIILDDPRHDQVTELLAQSLEGKTIRIKPGKVVLCTGGIETARILLTNSAQQKEGIGNSNDLVGRYFQDHPSAVVGTVQTSCPDQLQRLFNTFYGSGLKYAPRISATRRFQEEKHILNASALLRFDGDNLYLQNVKEALALLRHGRGGYKSFKALAKGAIHIPALFKPAWKYAVHGRAYTPHPTIRVVVFTEQEPNRESRILLNDQKDALGLRRADVRWMLTELTLKTVSTYSHALRAEFQRLGLGELVLAQWMTAAPDVQFEQLGDLFHHIGSTRMSESPAQGVVDPQCRVHGIANLSIASSSVFPTGGHSNPTLTLLALTFRLADRLKSELD